MNNAELIKALRWCGGEDERHEMCVDESYRCPMWNEDRITDECKAELMTTAADALDAANKRIVNLLTALYLANEKLAYVDCQPYTEIDGEEMIDDWVKTLVYEELHTQLPKDGEWIVTTEVSDDGAVTSHINCSRCGFYWREPKHGKVFKRCPNCGSRMRRGEQE